MTSERFQNVACSLLHKPVWPAPTEMLGLMADTLDSMRLCDDGFEICAGENTERPVWVLFTYAHMVLSLYSLPIIG